jgi:hypothetical protein
VKTEGQEIGANDTTAEPSRDAGPEKHNAGKKPALASPRIQAIWPYRPLAGLSGSPVCERSALKSLMAFC